ncbi:MAG: COX15/CtaA family protein [Bacteroidota bacterium]
MAASQKSNTNKKRLFRRFGFLTLVVVYIVILAGGIVRSTGSGMGCPDWPKCFGSWVPPTGEAQLPLHFKEIYTAQRVKKSVRIANMLERMGFTNTAYILRTDPSIRQEQPFNVVKTWIEYINRLAGALTGLFIVTAFALSFVYWKTDKFIVLLSAGSVALVGFQGWIGSIVVAANLMPFTVTLHMALAILLVWLIIYTLARAEHGTGRVKSNAPLRQVQFAAWFVFALTFIQVMIGTDVREEVDIITASSGGSHNNIMYRLGTSYLVHRAFSVLVLASCFGVVRAIRLSYPMGHSMRSMAWILFVLLLLEPLVGIGMAAFDLPAFLQPVHLTLATIIIGLVLYIAVKAGYGFDKSEAFSSVAGKMAGTAVS